MFRKTISSILALGLSTFMLVMNTGCEKEIPFDAEVKQPKLVINSLFSQDSIWKVHISNSLSVIDDAEPQSISNANVRIMDSNGSEIEVLQSIGNGFYTSPTNLHPQVGSTYQVEASLSEYTTVNATDAIPSDLNIISVDTVRTIHQGDSVMEISITFADNPGSADFYHIYFPYSETWIWNQDTNTYVYPIAVQTSDPLVSKEFGEDYLTDIFLEDKAFEGQNYTLKVYLDLWTFDYPVDESQLDVVIVSSSESYYRYRKSYYAYRQAEGNPFAQPVQVYSNVANGFGIFAGGNKTISNLIP